MQPSLPQAATLDLSIDIQTSTYFSLVQFMPCTDIFVWTIFCSNSDILANSAVLSNENMPASYLGTCISASTRVTSSPRTHQDEISLSWQGLRSQGNSWWMPSKRTTKMHQERLQASVNKLPALSSQTYGSYKSSIACQAERIPPAMVVPFSQHPKFWPHDPARVMNVQHSWKPSEFQVF